MKRRIRKPACLLMALAITAAMCGCGSQKNAETSANSVANLSPEELKFPLAEKAELSFITSAPASTTQDPNERMIFKRLEDETNLMIRRILLYQALPLYQMVYLMQE